MRALLGTAAHFYKVVDVPLQQNVGSIVPRIPEPQTLSPAPQTLSHNAGWLWTQGTWLRLRRVDLLQGYLTHEKQKPPRTLQ